MTVKIPGSWKTWEIAEAPAGDGVASSGKTQVYFAGPMAFVSAASTLKFTDCPATGDGTSVMMCGVTALGMTK